jgi:hypothetical protein
MITRSIAAGVLVAALILPGAVIAQGSAGTGNTSTGIGGAGRPRGTWDTKERLDAAARGSDEHDNREQQSHAIAEGFDSAAKCPGLPEVPQMTGWAKAGNDVELWKFRAKALDYLWSEGAHCGGGQRISALSDRHRRGPRLFGLR